MQLRQPFDISTDGGVLFSKLEINYSTILFQDDEMNLAKSLESNCSQIYSKMFSLEKELNLLFSTISVNNNNNVNNNNENSESRSRSTLNCFAYSPIYFQTDLKIA